jgi:hypothetical protein
MTKHRALPVVGLLLLVAALGLVPSASTVRAAADTIPARLTDQEFWKLSVDSSEPDGYFRSDNLLSNEIWFQYVIPDLVQRAKPGGVYLGVGPEQNFSYISAIKPKIVFINDVRRGNLHTQLMYKALFELSADRAEFVSRLFTKKRPDGLGPKSTISEIFNAFWNVETSPEPVYRENLKSIQDLLTKKHNLPLTPDDLAGIEYVYYNFYYFGPVINYNSSSGSGSGGRGGGNYVNYADLMVATDAAGVSRSFLANDENFKVLKDLEEKNLVVPVIGNFGGPKALRAIGKWVRDHGATVTAFYLSNVEQYLYQDGIWQNFCGNVASMPLDEPSTFIRSSQGGGGGGRGGGLMSYLGNMQSETKGCGGSSQSRIPGVQPSR